MIITERLQWFHLPKTAGTTTDQLFGLSGLPLIWRDPQDSSMKHLPVSEHPEAQRLVRPDRVSVVNFRRLPWWLLSNYQHKLGAMGLALDREPLADGLFYRHRQDAWLPADWWLDRFAVADHWQFLRVEHLKADFTRLLEQFQPAGFRSRLAIALAPSRNRRRYERDLSTWFSATQLRRIYDANPRWSALEQRLYGHLLC